MKQKILFFLALSCCVQSQLLSQVSFGEAIKINDNWQFKNREYADEFRKKPDPWRTLDLPHDWSVEGTHSPSLASCTGYLPGGIGWYKKTLFVPESDRGKRLYIYFGGVYCNSEVWVNDHSLGVRPNGYVAFMYDMTPYINYGGDNNIVVKVDHSKYADSRWYTGSGIYRDVYLIKAGQVHIDQWGVHCYPEKITKNQARLVVATTVKNNTMQDVSVVVEQALRKKNAKENTAEASKSLLVKAGSTAKVEALLKVNAPVLWSVDDPQLYELHTSLIQEEKKIDGCVTTTGIREIRFDANEGFFLNGKNMKLKGVCLHHDAGCLGSAVPKVVWEGRLKELKKIGCNAIRMSHNPQDAAVYEIADEIGLLVMDEAFDEWEYQKRKWIEGWNVGVPLYDGYAEYFNEWGERDITDMVNHHKNHPSIIMWSIGNEVDYPNDPYSHPVLDVERINQKAVLGYKPQQPHAERLGVIAEKLVACVKRIDTSRPVTAALAGVVMSNHTNYPFVIDVVGYNYTENRYEKDHAQYPDRILYGSENRHELAHWHAVTNNNYIAGQFLWTGIDYLGESHAWPSRGFDSGLLNYAGFKKPRGYYRESLWSDKPMVYIGARPEKTIKKQNLLIDVQAKWNFQPQEEIRVVAFSNCEKVVLFLNGKAINKPYQIDEKTGGKYWIIPFEEGILEAVAYINEVKVADFKIQTSERPETISCKSSVDQLTKKGDIAMLEVTLLDKNGTPSILADDMITCRTSGPVRIMGMENSNPTDMTDFHCNKLRAYQGRLLIYLQATADTGAITIELSGAWLKPASFSYRK